MGISKVSGNLDGWNKCMWDTNQFNRSKVIQIGPESEKIALVLPTLGAPHIELVELRARCTFKITPYQKENGKPKFRIELKRAVGLPKQRLVRRADDY